MRSFLLLLFWTLLAGGCASTDSLRATAWVRTSAEYRALTTQVYASAEARLQEFMRSNKSSASIVVMDIDETVLDNSGFQEELIVENAEYSDERWDTWIAAQKATEVPGAVKFIDEAQRLHFEVVYVTNRSCHDRNGTDPCPQKSETRANLIAIGVQAGASRIFMVNDVPPAACQKYLPSTGTGETTWGTDKEPRRQCVADSGDLVLFVGDDLGDFIPLRDVLTMPQRCNLIKQNTEHWGYDWFMLPNPIYGSWLRALQRETGTVSKADLPLRVCR